MITRNSYFKHGLLLFCIGLSQLLYSQVENNNYSSLSESKICTANYTDEKPIIDGKVLSDEVWNSMTPIGALTQSQPSVGGVPSEKTAIRIAYDKKNIYISAVCYDATPDKLVMSDARRDAPLDETDAFLFADERK